MDLYKVHGATERQDSLVRISDNNYLLIFGFGKDSDSSESGYNWRKNYNNKPTIEELRSDIETLVNSLIDEKIRNGFSWNGKPVYLSSENQFNFKAACDLAFQTDGANLPSKFKLGEDADGNHVYHTFTKTDELADFVMRAFAFINTTLIEGWNEKDSIDYTKFE